MNKHNLLFELGLPEQFGVVLLLLALILLLAPYLAGQDLGVIKVPPFTPSSKRILRVFGPLAMLAALFLHVPFFGKQKKQATQTSQEGSCLLAGVVFDGGSNKRLSGVWIDLYRDQSSIGQRPAILKRSVATTGPDGRFSFDCSWVDKSQFPILLGV